MTRILNIEDEQQISSLVKLAVADNLGYDVVLAETLQEAIQIYDSREKDFDLSIVDRQLPDGEGYDFIRHIRGKGDQTNIMMYSGYANAENEELAYSLGANDFLHKPFNMSEFVEKVQKLISSSSS
jgi:DNA-binding response OmpR family regulator